VDRSSTQGALCTVSVFLFYILLIWGGVRTHPTHPPAYGPVYGCRSAMSDRRCWFLGSLGGMLAGSLLARRRVPLHGTFSPARRRRRDLVSPFVFTRTTLCYCLVLAIVLCRLSVTSLSSVETDERIELVFGVGASFHPSYAVLKGNSVTSRNNGTLAQSPDLKMFFSVYRSSKRVVDLARERWTLRV